MAQLVAHLIRNEGVGGSSPSCGTTKSIQNQSVRAAKASTLVVWLIRNLYNSKRKSSAILGAAGSESAAKQGGVTPGARAAASSACRVNTTSGAMEQSLHPPIIRVGR